MKSDQNRGKSFFIISCVIEKTQGNSVTNLHEVSDVFVAVDLNFSVGMLVGELDARFLRCDLKHLNLNQCLLALDHCVIFAHEL